MHMQGYRPLEAEKAELRAQISEVLAQLGGRAEADGYVVNRTPAVGAVFQTDEGFYGHVAYVIAVDNLTGAWTISEMNTVGLNIVSKRTFSKESAALYKFIHNKRGASPWNPQPISPI